MIRIFLLLIISNCFYASCYAEFREEFSLGDLYAVGTTVELYGECRIYMQSNGGSTSILCSHNRNIYIVKHSTVERVEAGYKETAQNFEKKLNTDEVRYRQNEKKIVNGFTHYLQSMGLTEKPERPIEGFHAYSICREQDCLRVSSKSWSHVRKIVTQFGSGNLESKEDAL